MKLFRLFFLIQATTFFAQAENVLAKIGDLEIRTDEIRETLAGLDKDQQAALAKNTNALNDYTKTLIVRKLVLKKAAEQKWEQEASVIMKLVQAREDAIIASFLDKVSENDPAFPSDIDLTSAYNTAKSKLLVPRSFQLAQIYIADDQKKLGEVTAQLKAKNADFGAIASTKSEEAVSAAKNGEIGWLTEEQIQPEIREQILKLAKGVVSEPIKLKDGWHILKVLDVRDAYTPTLDQVREQLIAQLKVEKTRLNRQEYLGKLLQENPVAINEIELQQISKNP